VYANAATSCGSYVFIGGGWLGYGSPSTPTTDIVDVYDTATGSWVLPPLHLSVARTGPSAASAAGSVFFAGGYSGGVFKADVDIFDNVTFARRTDLPLGEPRTVTPGASLPTAVFFGGGSSTVRSSMVDIYDKAGGSWVHDTSQRLPAGPRADLGEAGAAGKVYFAGGSTNSSPQTNLVEIYNYASRTWASDTLSEARTTPAAATVGNLVLFAGGGGASGPSDMVDIFDASTGSHTSGHWLSVARNNISAATAGSKVYFAGGGANPFSDVIDVYDATTRMWSVEHLAIPRTSFAAAGAGNEALFAGGAAYSYPTGGLTDKVEIHTAPEPSTFVLLGAGALALVGRVWRRRRQTR
jgi:hypothetical protein